MLHLDGVIYSLQQTGGISVLFDEILKRLPEEKYTLDIPRLSYPWSRYCNASFDSNKSIFHSTYYRLPEGKSAGIVTTVHDFTYERFARGIRKSLHGWQKRKAISGADIIICVSESTKADLYEFVKVGRAQKVIVVPNGVSMAYRHLACSIEQQVLFVGARGSYKNFRNVVLALARSPDIMLVCVGGGEYSREEKKFLEETIPGRYRHAGRLTNEELNEEYNKSICLVYPSLYEGFGIPILEAMNAGCPVIAVRSSSIPEVAGDAAWLLESGSVEEIAGGVDFFRSNVNRERFIMLGFSQASKFSWDITYRRTLEVYEELLGEKL
ncbi:glycosyltransferase family 1 protein [Pseudomonas proteolytica]|uniref:glycosyltransferase family 4 protein n=1 Tax=Pseudomonas proteolytica TaxID=219574 RepID=UPI0030D8CA5C